jgi:hypothetical protein
MRKKSEEQKIQQEQQRQKIQEFHQQDKLRSDVSKIQEQHPIEFKAIEQVAKLINQQPETLTPQNIKDILPLLQKAEAEALQRILESQNLQNIQRKYKEAKLEEKGINQKFSNELQMLQAIAKNLNIPVEKLTQDQIQTFLKQNKTESFIPRTRPEGTDPKQGEAYYSVDSSKTASRLSQIRGLLESLGAKQEEILRQMTQQRDVKRELDKVSQQIAKLELKLNQLRDDLFTKPVVSEDQGQDKAVFQESVAEVKRNIQEMREKVVIKTTQDQQKMPSDEQTEPGTQVLRSERQ